MTYILGSVLNLITVWVYNLIFIIILVRNFSWFLLILVLVQVITAWVFKGFIIGEIRERKQTLNQTSIHRKERK